MAEIIHNQKVFSLHEVLNSIQKTLSARYQSAYWMRAEMNKLNFYAYSGHCYPDLVEKSEGKVIAQARAIIWSADFQNINHQFKQLLKEPLKDGINILFLAKITFTAAHGLSLQILDIDPSYSLGILEKEKQETIDRLQKEGIFHKNQKLAFPLLPQRIAVISVETSKGYADFLKILNQNPFGYKFIQHLFPARLQGDAAVTDIARQLQKIKKTADYFDVVVIIRGGGGEVGLAAFNQYPLAKAIAGFPIPVLTGIGHATNKTISEMVAYKNAITPTECAQFLLDCFRQFEVAVQTAQQKLLRFTQLQINRQKEKLFFVLQLILKNCAHAFQTQHNQLNQSKLFLKKQTAYIFQTRREQLLQQKQLFSGQIKNLFQQRKSELAQMGKNIELVSPESVLKRGFSITRFKGKVISPEGGFPETGDKIETEFLSQILTSTVIQQHKKNRNGK